MESEDATEISALKNDLRMVIGELTLHYIELLATQDAAFEMLNQCLSALGETPDSDPGKASANRQFREALERRFLLHEQISPGSAAQLQTIHEQRNPSVWEE